MVFDSKTRIYRVNRKINLDLVLNYIEKIPPKNWHKAVYGIPFGSQFFYLAPVSREVYVTKMASSVLVDFRIGFPESNFVLVNIEYKVNGENQMKINEPNHLILLINIPSINSNEHERVKTLTQKLDKKVHSCHNNSSGAYCPTCQDLGLG
ncbi:hypothetical protein J4474_01475 [Candidatus Pacearchaeota archaeon]|nr:hypothetical protein [Candidatus Pacearchaeota archaeon]